MKHLVILTIITLCLLPTCKKEEFSPRPFPRVKTIEITEVSEEGVILQAEFIREDNFEIIRYGFVWGFSQEPILGGTSEAVFQGSPEKNEFSFALNGEIFIDRTYYVRAFLQTEDFIVYGNSVSFLSQGGKAPIIRSYSPKVGSWGDTLSIIGENFSRNPDANFARLGQIRILPVSNSDTLLRFVIPPIRNNIEVGLFLTVFGKTATDSTNFKYNVVEIVGVNPTSGIVGDSIEIGIKDFNPNYTSLTVGGGPVEFRFKQDSILVFALPDFLEEPNPQIIVLSAGIAAFYDDFQLKGVQIEDVSPNQGTWGDSVFVKISNIDPNALSVMFGGESIAFFEKSKSEIGFIVPNNLDLINPILQLEANGFTAVDNRFRLIIPDAPQITSGNIYKYGDTLTIETNVVHPELQANTLRFASNPIINPFDLDIEEGILHFIIPNELQFSSPFLFLDIGPFSYGLETIELLKPVFETISVDTIKTFRPEITITGKNLNLDPNFNRIIISNQDRAIAIPPSDVLFLNSNEIRFQLKEPFPDNRLITVKEFVQLRITTFFMTEATYPIPIDYHSTWTNIGSTPFGFRIGSVSFETNNRGYFGLGSTNNGLDPSFYEYRPGENLWELIDPFPGEGRIGSSSIQIGNFTYVGLGSAAPGQSNNSFNDFYRLNPINKAWFGRIEFPGRTRIDVRTMIHQGQAYLIGGRGNIPNSEYPDDIWQFNPNEASWTELDIPLPLDYGLPFTINGQGYLNSPGFINRFDGNRWTNIPKSISVAGEQMVVFQNRLYFGFDPQTAEVGVFDPDLGLTIVRRIGLPNVQYLFTIEDIAYFYTSSGNQGTLWTFDPRFPK